MNRMIGFLLACLVLSLPLGRLALAQDNGTPEDQQACEPDVHRLCSTAGNDRDKIVVCLNQKVRQLSPACRIVILYAVQARICANDLARLCEGTSWDRDKAFECEQRNIHKLGSSCRNAFTIYARERTRQH